MKRNNRAESVQVAPDVKCLLLRFILQVSRDVDWFTGAIDPLCGLKNQSQWRSSAGTCTLSQRAAIRSAGTAAVAKTNATRAAPAPPTITAVFLWSIGIWRPASLRDFRMFRFGPFRGNQQIMRMQERLRLIYCSRHRTWLRGYSNRHGI